MDAKVTLALTAMGVLALVALLTSACGWLPAPLLPAEPICVEAPFADPSASLQDRDLVGTWATVYDGASDRLIINEDGTFKQVYEERIAQLISLYRYETPRNRWWVERFPDGRIRIHLEGARYYYRGAGIAELEGMADGPDPLPWFFHDPFAHEYLEARTKTVFQRVFGVTNMRGTQPVLPICGVFGQSSRDGGRTCTQCACRFEG